jgi:hypothetical protein
MTLEQRVDLLEKELARTRRLARWAPCAAVLACLLAFGLFEPMAARLFAQPAAAPAEIRANAFILTDARNAERASLRLTDNEPVLTLNGNSARVEMGAFSDGSSLLFSGADRKPKILMFSHDEGEALVMYGKKGTSSHAELGVYDDYGSLIFGDSSGHIIWEAP